MLGEVSTSVFTVNIRGQEICKGLVVCVYVCVCVCVCGVHALCVPVYNSRNM